MIMTRKDWEEAASNGFITPEHMMVRLKNIVVYAFENEGAIGFDEYGFVTALTAGGLSVSGGITLRIHPNDHPPPHVHIELRSHPNSRLRVRLDNGELLGKPPAGIKARKLRGIQSIVWEHNSVLVELWDIYRGEGANW